MTNTKRQALLLWLFAVTAVSSGFSIGSPSCRSLPTRVATTPLFSTAGTEQEQQDPQFNDSPSPVIDDAAFDDAVDTILDAMYDSKDGRLVRQARDFEKELESDYVQTIWLTRIINAWARSSDFNAVEQAEYILNTMTKFYNAGYDYVKPNTVTYNSLINCLAHSRDKVAAEKSEKLINEMWRLVESGENPSVRPSTITYSSVMKAWSKSTAVHKKGERAEGLLRKQWERFEDGGSRCKPDGRTYNNVIAAWAHSTSKVKGTYAKAQVLVDEMWRLYEEDGHDEEMKPNKVTMTYLLTSLSNEKFDVEATQKAEAIVQDMWEMSEDQSDMKPNAIVYTALMHVWLHSRDREAIHRIQALLDEMKERFYENGEADFRPNLGAYMAVIEKLSHVPMADSVDRAETLLEEMWNRTAAGESFVRPTSDVYQYVLQARSKSKRKDSPDVAERILHEMVDGYKKGDRRLMPNTAMFHSVFKTFGNHKSRSSSKKAVCDPNRVEALLEEMYQLQKDGIRRVAPDRLTMTVIMDLLTQNYDRSCLLKAEDILQTMWRKSVGTGRPDSITYLTLMSAWTKSRENDAVEHAEALFEDLWRRYEANPHHKLKPETTICNAMITAYARSRRMDAVEKAQEIFDDMVRRSAEGDTSIAPDTVTYNSIINSLSKSKRPGSAEKAEQLLRDMWRHCEETGDRKGKPNVITISTVVDAWSHSKDPEAPRRCQALLEEAWDRYHAGDEDIKPNQFTYTPTILAWTLSPDPEGAFNAEQLMNQMWEEGINPNKIIYGHIITSYAKHKSKESAERAEALLRDQWKRYDAGDKFVKPDLVGCNAAIVAWANSDAEDGAERAHAILNEMLDRTPAGNRDSRPSRLSYNLVLSAWSKSGHKDGAHKAQSLIDELWSRHQKNPRACVCPDRINYTNVISAWARSGDEQAIKKASAIMDTLWKRVEDGDQTMQPDCVAYSSMLHVLMNSETPDLYDRATALYQEMKDRDIQFTTRFFVAYVKALGSKTGTGDEIEEVFREMEAFSKRGMDCKPDTFLYNSAITYLAKTSQENGIQRAHAILEGMWKRFEETNDKRYKPDITTYTFLLRALCRNGSTSARTKSQKLVDEVGQRRADGDADFAHNGLFERIKASMTEQTDLSEDGVVPDFSEESAAAHSTAEDAPEESVVVVDTAIQSLTLENSTSDISEESVPLVVVAKDALEEIVVTDDNPTDISEEMIASDDTADKSIPIEEAEGEAENEITVALDTTEIAESPVLETAPQNDEEIWIDDNGVICYGADPKANLLLSE